MLAFVPFLAASHAFAMSPTLSLANEGGNSIEMTVYGDPNSSVILDYQTTYSGVEGAGILGYTNTSGYFTTTLSTSAYNFGSGTEVYVIVDGQQSSSTVWPTSSIYNTYNYNNGYSTSYGTLTLSQTTVNLSIGQSTSITAYNNGGIYNTYNNVGTGSLYVSTNSNPSVATVTAYGNELTIIGDAYGSTTVNVCSAGSVCSVLYITVNSGTYYNNNNYYNYQYQTSAITFSQTSLTLAVGQTTTMSVYGGSGTNYYISSTAGIVQSTLNGNILTLYGLSPGSESLQVCSTYEGNLCGSLYVTVSGNGINQTTQQLSLSSTNLQLTAGQTESVAIYGDSSYPNYTSEYYISSNSNPSVTTATINGNILTVYGNSVGSGSDVITVCQSDPYEAYNGYNTYSSYNGGYGCATLTVNIIGGYSYYNNGYVYPSYPANTYPYY